MQVRILVVGTGAIGGFYGGKLAQAGASVTTLCRSDYEIVKARGISVSSTLGDFHFTPDKVIRDITEYTPPPDYLLVGLKVLPETNTAEIIKNAVGRETAIVLLQNGVETLEAAEHVRFHRTNRHAGDFGHFHQGHLLGETQRHHLPAFFRKHG